MHEVHTAFYDNLAEFLSYSTSWKGMKGFSGQQEDSALTRSTFRNFFSSQIFFVGCLWEVSSQFILPVSAHLFSLVGKKSRNLSLKECERKEAVGRERRRKKFKRRREKLSRFSTFTWTWNGRWVGDFYFLSLSEKTQESRSDFLIKMRLLRDFWGKEIALPRGHARLLLSCFHWSSFGTKSNRNPKSMTSQKRDSLRETFRVTTHCVYQ